MSEPFAVLLSDLRAIEREETLIEEREREMELRRHFEREQAERTEEAREWHK